MTSPSLEQLLCPEWLFVSVEGVDNRTVLAEVARRVEATGQIKKRGRLFDRLWEREQLCTTAVGRGVAIPHCKLEGLDRPLLGVATLRSAIDFQAPDDEPVQLLFVLVSPVKGPALHLQALAAVSKWIKKSSHLDQISELATPEAIHEALTGQPVAP